MNLNDLKLLSPEIFLSVSSIILLVLSLSKVDLKKIINLSIISLIISILLVCNLWFGWLFEPSSKNSLLGSFTSDNFSLFFKFIILLASLITIFGSFQYFVSEKTRNYFGEFISLIFLSIVGMMLLVSSTELITIYVSLELSALPIIVLLSIHRSKLGIESGIKFFILSAFSSAILLYGFIYLYGLTGSTNLLLIQESISKMSLTEGSTFIAHGLIISIVLIIAGFSFKMAIVPWQMWIPDVYQGAPTPIAAFLSVASKSSAFAVIIRLFYTSFSNEDLMLDWSLIFAVLAAITMTIGNLFALNQKNIKRLLGYSTIAQAGYILIGLAAIPDGNSINFSGIQGSMYYLAGYLFTNISIFIVITIIILRTKDQTIDGLSGFIKVSPVYSIILVVGLLSLIGMPPTVGFMSKVIIFGFAINSGYPWLALIGVINSVLAAFYYLRIIRFIVFEEPSKNKLVQSNLLRDNRAILVGVICSILVLLLGIIPFILLDMSKKAINFI
ncbi:MAG: NADH-quinone oxidoreductase subunit N [SAR202 cluster bacterium]|nr:NADH-quinone oxidoreductase subunit N [SAR202 cluster bacterium]